MGAGLEWAAAKDLYPNYPHGIWDKVAKALGKNIKDSERVHHGGQQVGCRRQSYRLWVTPDSRIKAMKEHWVPLIVKGLEILSQAQELTKRSPLIFCHPKTKKPFGNGISTSLLHKGLGVPYTMHGFRSSFRDWGSEKTNHPRELLAVSLAHLPGDQTEQAYWRGDMIERRMSLMEDWARFAAS